MQVKSDIESVRMKMKDLLQIENKKYVKKYSKVNKITIVFKKKELKVFN